MRSVTSQVSLEMILVDAFYAILWYDKSKYMIEKNRQSGCVS